MQLDALAARIDNLYGPPMQLISESLRSLIVAAPGNELFDADFSNIEGRGLAWAAGEEWKLDAFRAFDAGTGPDLYKVAYSRSFGVPVESVTKAQRQVGKVQELALGYQGAYGALVTMASAFGIEVPPPPEPYWEDVDTGERYPADTVKPGDTPPDNLRSVRPQHPWVQAWREAHPKVKAFWYALEDAARNAIMYPGEKFTAGAPGREVTFKVAGSFLWCRLQSGRVLCYPYPRIGDARTPWGIKKDAILYKYVNQTTRKWMEGPTYGGALAENVIQAICRDLLAGALFRVEEAGYPVVLHVHDSILSERAIGTGDAQEFAALMAQGESWSAGWPISVAVKTGKRWG